MKRNYLGRFAPKFTREEKYLGILIIALYLYQRNGTQDWQASAKCWDR